MLGKLALLGRPRLLFCAVLLTFICLSIGYNVLQPIWEAPDEPYHYAFIRYIQVHHILPRGQLNLSTKIPEMDPTKEYSQTPLYYLFQAAVLSPVRLPPEADFHANP